jgi:phage N-6-adenine-methyltransferase
MTEPAQKPGRSRQDYGTPISFIHAVENRFGGPITWDLAAHADNAKCANYYDQRQDSLAQDWTQLRGNLWLNPPFADIEPWARKCKESRVEGRRIFLLTPASVGSLWFAEHVHGHALVLGLCPRLRFEGAKDDYPRDLILSVYSAHMRIGFEVWKWKEDVIEADNRAHQLSLLGRSA